ncbi:hypothetical protein PPACK8108_LOCUS5117 [Phakopsora pachyrhizi]|uniref:Uncharacterized protein n=1 Tax=Phakopsora pachyrhizi TaxID=170000 RepID=A0AAV0AQA4_PHAPC|nr:hypothetical protein PPACK8108_LOCUS5117 [Phakopsora pachyrhizi]
MEQLSQPNFVDQRTRGALRMQQNLNNSQLVDHPPREEDIQKNPPEQNPNLQQPIPVPDEQQKPAQALNSHGQMLDQVNRAVAARNIPPASSGLARLLSAFAKFVWLEEAQTDRLDYDLRGWEPVEYEYLKVYLAVNSESKISDYTEDRDLIRVSICEKFQLGRIQRVALVSTLDGQVNMTCPVAA